LTLGAQGWGDYDVLSDGTFVAIVADRLSRDQPLTAILNWPAEIRR
jgi:hypothetical protein